MKKQIMLLIILLGIFIALLGHSLGYWQVYERDGNENSYSNDFVVEPEKPLVYDVRVFGFDNGSVIIRKVRLVNEYLTDNTIYGGEEYNIALISNDSRLLYENTFDILFDEYLPYREECFVNGFLDEEKCPEDSLVKHYQTREVVLYAPYNDQVDKIYVYDNLGLIVVSYDAPRKEADNPTEIISEKLDIDGVIEFFMLFLAVLIAGTIYSLLKKR